MRRVTFPAILLLAFLLASCTTPSYVIDNSRLKFQEFDPMVVSALAIELVDNGSDTDLAAILAGLSPDIAVIRADRKTIAGLVDTIPMNVAKVSPTVIIATTGEISSKDEHGAMVLFDETYGLQVRIESYEGLIEPVLVAGGDGNGMVEDIYLQTHGGDTETVPFTIYQAGVLPLGSTDIRDAYAGCQGVSCTFAVSD